MVRYTQMQTHTVSTAQFGCLQVYSDEFTWISVHCVGTYNCDSYNSSVALCCYVRDATQKSPK